MNAITSIKVVVGKTALVAINATEKAVTPVIAKVETRKNFKAAKKDLKAQMCEIGATIRQTQAFEAMVAKQAAEAQKEVEVS